MKNNYEQYIKGINDLENLLNELTEDQLKYKPDKNRWNVNEILAHLAEAEVQAYVRYRAVLADDIPFLMNFNQDNWSKELNHAGIPIYESFSLFKSMRNINYNLICSLSEEQMNREGLHSIRGKVTVRNLFEDYLGHLDIHMTQIKKNISVYKNYQNK